MEYSEFEKKLLSQLKNDDQDKSLQNTEKPIHIKSLVDGINDIVINKQNNFDTIEKVLTTESMKCVLSEFRNSNVMLAACKKNNISAVKWLLQMKINPYIQDENGMTALMHAAKNNLISIFPQLVNENDKYINMVDKNNENALFHAINNPNSFEKLLKTNIDFNNLNKQNENVLLCSCRYDLRTNVSNLLSKPNLDYNKFDKEGRTALMHLLDHENYMFFCKILNQIKKEGSEYNINYRSKLNNESILSIFIKKYYEMYCNKTFEKKNKEKIYLINCIGRVYASILSFPGFDINIPIDENGNTAIMVFIMMNDYVMIDFTLSYCKDIDLSIKNKYGVNASVFTMNLREEDNLIKTLMQHKTFDTHYLDEHNNSILMYFVFFKNECTFLKIVNENNNEKLIKHVNDKNEDAIILGTKLGIFDHVNSYNIRNANINQQDYLGNSALFYAVKLKNKYDINLLAYCHADPNLKNNQGMSPIDLAKQLGEEDLIKIMKKPKPVHKMKKELESGKGSGFSLFGKKKSSDEKIENYLPRPALKQLAIILYHFLNKCSYHMIRCIDPRTEYGDRKEIFYEDEFIIKDFETFILTSYDTKIIDEALDILL